MAKSDGEKRKGKDSDKESGKSGKKGPGVLRRFLAALALVALLSYIACGVALSSESVRRDVCERVGKRLGVQVEAESSHLGLPFAIVLRNVKTENYPDGAAGFAFERLRLSPQFGGRWRVSCERGSVRLVCSRDNSWEPQGLSALGPVAETDLSQVSRFTDEFCSNMTLEISDMTVRWVQSGGEVAAAGGVSFVVRPANLAERRVSYHALNALSVVGSGGARATDVRREWLAGGGMIYNEVVREGGEAKGNGIFWEGTRP